MILSLILTRLVRRGRLTVIDADGQRTIYGTEPGTSSTIRLTDPNFGRKLLIDASLAMGEGYMDGSLIIEEGSLYDLLALLMENVQIQPRSALKKLATAIMRPLQQFNPVTRARKNVAHHYDLSSTLYDLFLDSDRQYSCAYFEHPEDDLETAQSNKKRHIAAKLLLEPGMKVLDIGSGWGGLALYLAQQTGAHVTGLTLSVEQQRYATDRARAAGMADRVRFHLRDYREEHGRYDRIVSVGMFEHVGLLHYGTFFEQVSALLADDGVALIHSIGRSDTPCPTNSWLRKYIFPGGYCPALSEVLPHLERHELWLTDAEILRLHYAETLVHWRRRFERNRARVVALYDERFCRMWEFYLVACELSFRVQAMMVFQLQFAKRVDTVPITRDYMTDWERLNAPGDQRPANVA